MSVQGTGQSVKDGGGAACEQSSPTSLDLCDQFMLAAADSVVVLDAGPTASNLVFRWLGRHRRMLERQCFPPVSTFLAYARFKFGNGRRGEVRRAADIPVGIGGVTGELTAVALEAGIPASLRKGVLGRLGAQLDFS